jgi:hypothetical protein
MQDNHSKNQQLKTDNAEYVVQSASVFIDQLKFEELGQMVVCWDRLYELLGVAPGIGIFG